jgi:ribosomal protein L3 glutamine methyltransferase
MNLTEARQHLKTANDWIRYTVTVMNECEVFHGHGVDNSYDEAIHLVLSALKLPAEQLNPFLHATVLPSEAELITEWIKQRCIERKPLPYIVGEAWLTGQKFFVNESVLIPRSFIAELLENRLEPWIDSPDIIGNVLDLCTGSGCLAILAGLAFPNAIIAASDISPAALEVADRNLVRHGREDIDLIEADLFDSDEFGTYDLILCNPPYVNDDSMETLPPEYLAEPGLALAGGMDGMNIIRRIFQHASGHLSPKGILLLEIGNEKENFDAAFPQLVVSWVDVSAGCDQVLMVTREQLIAADLG